MTQIKVISEAKPEEFERKVNDALQNGWSVSNLCIMPTGGFSTILARETPVATDFTQRQ